MNTAQGPGRAFILSAPSSGAGKTTVTLAILRALKNRGIAVRSGKSGPDYIDPRFHQAASGAPCMNFDAWAMSAAQIKTLAAGQAQAAEILVIEGAMGLFDGAPPRGKGATADLAHILKLPVVLIVDAAKTAQSIAPLVQGFLGFDRNVTIAGVILNNTGSARHETMLRTALRPLGVQVIGALRRDPTLALPARHLGLVQAGEHPGLEAFLENAAAIVTEALDLDALIGLGTPLPAATSTRAFIPPPAQQIAIARDPAFAFTYPHLLQSWHAAGAELRFFSPLANDAVPDAGFVWLPGGYPELHAARLAAAETFMASLQKVAGKNIPVFGECGGYMLLGKGLTDKDGTRHKMCGLLPLETSFAKPKLHLGYRQLTALDGPFKDQSFAGHEFHYATTLRAAGPALFAAKNAEGEALPDMGLVQGSVSGSFGHLICSTP